MKKVLLGMSGGIDSTASAVLLIEQGYKVTGLTFVMDYLSNDSVSKAKIICKKLNIEHITIDITKIFKEKVVSYFISEYEHGKTPNPCIECNRFVKFGYIYDYAIKNNYDYISTGHYAIIDTCNDMLVLKSSVDKKKDQTYFLHVIKEDQLKHILFPLGTLNKEIARDICAKNNLLPRESKESQEICFIQNTYKEFLIEHNAKNKLGNFIYENNDIIKKHDGIINYTIGQRKGMNLAIGKPAYVKDINYSTGDVTISDNKSLYCDTVYANNLSLINNIIPNNEDIYAKIRYGAKKAKVTIKIDNDIIKTTFFEKQRAVTKGQTIVFYTNNYVIGGAKILKGVNENE